MAEAHAGRALGSPASPIPRLFLASALTATSTCFTSATRIEVSTRESPAQLQVLPRRDRSADRSPLRSVSKCTSSPKSKAAILVRPVSDSETFAGLTQFAFGSLAGECKLLILNGEMAEWSMAHAWKAVPNELPLKDGGVGAEL